MKADILLAPSIDACLSPTAFDRQLKYQPRRLCLENKESSYLLIDLIVWRFFFGSEYTGLILSTFFSWQKNLSLVVVGEQREQQSCA